MEFRGPARSAKGLCFRSARRPIASNAIKRRPTPFVHACGRCHQPPATTSPRAMSRCRPTRASPRTSRYSKSPSGVRARSHRRPPDFQPSDIGAAEGRCWGGSARPDHIDQLHSEAEEFRHRHQLVESRPLDAERVNITADDVRGNPAVSIASAVRKPNEPLPCPMSKMTPRRRASSTSSRIRPSCCTGASGNGRKQCVRMSPRRRRVSTSSRLGGGLSRCAMTGNPVSSATSSAMSRGATPEAPPAFAPRAP